VSQEDSENPETSAQGTDGALGFDYSTAKLSFEGLDPTDFEELCFELLQVVGYINVGWRKGTPKASSPADRGRDIVAQREQVDADGYRRLELRPGSSTLSTTPRECLPRPCKV